MGNPGVGGEVCTGSGRLIHPSFLVSALTTDGGEKVPEAGLNAALEGRGVVTGSVARDDGGACGVLMGTVFAVRDLSGDGGAFDLVGSGVVFCSNALTNGARDTFFAPGNSEVKGIVVSVEEPTGPNEEGVTGAVGPIMDGREAFDSWRLGGKCVTPGGVSGARFDASDSSLGAEG
jgi:hypothetical protein